MKINGWKVTAIIFIILFVLETAFFIFILNVGMNVIEDEIECSDWCMETEEATSYLYFEENNLCQCYQSGEIIEQGFIE